MDHGRGSGKNPEVIDPKLARMAAQMDLVHDLEDEKETGNWILAPLLSLTSICTERNGVTVVRSD